ncbi:hypothetical protein FAGKG844_50124 [Frankia sp. AgKG'84/4]
MKRVPSRRCQWAEGSVNGARRNLGVYPEIPRPAAMRLIVHGDGSIEEIRYSLTFRCPIVSLGCGADATW